MMLLVVLLGKVVNLEGWISGYLDRLMYGGGLNASPLIFGHVE